MRAMAAGSVVSSTWSDGAGRRRPEGAGEHLGEQARAAHAHDEHVVDVVGRQPRTRPASAGEVVEHLAHHGDPAEPVGDLGGVVAPERVVAREQPARLASAVRDGRSRPRPVRGLPGRPGEVTRSGLSWRRPAMRERGGGRAGGSPDLVDDGVGVGEAGEQHLVGAGREGHAPRSSMAWKKAA